MTEADIEIILERAKELHQEVRPRIISDNGPKFIAKDFNGDSRRSAVVNSKHQLPSGRRLAVQCAEATSGRRSATPQIANSPARRPASRLS
jgi:hypothetical protein